MLDSRRHLLLLGALTLACLPAAQAQPSPAPIRLVVPYPPGGPLDTVARALAAQAKASLGPVVVENRPGAGGNLGADVVAKAAPDGRTLLMGAVATHAINPWLYSRMPYDALRDFTPITRVAQVPNVLVMNAQKAQELRINSVADLVAYARANPGRLNYGSGGNGSAGHLAGEMFKARAGLFMVHIPYAGAAPAQLALVSGQVDLNLDNLAGAAANIKAGKLKALAVTTARRSSALPEVPALAEAGKALGLDGFDVSTWFGIFAPAGLAPAEQQRLHKGLTEALESTEMRQRLAALWSEPAAQTPEAFSAFVRAENEKYRQVVQAIGVRAN